MSSFSWEYIYSFYQSYFLFHLQDFSNSTEANHIHRYVDVFIYRSEFFFSRFTSFHFMQQNTSLIQNK